MKNNTAKQSSKTDSIHVSKKSRLSFHELVIRKEGEEYVIGRKYSAVYIAIPPIGLEALNLLKHNHSIEETIDVLNKKYKESVEIDSFVENLISKGFVKSIDGRILSEQKKELKGWFTWIQQRHVAWLFSKPALIIYGAMSLFALFLILLNPQYIPKYQDMFFYDWLAVIILATFLVGWILVFKHEMFHLLAARSVGVDARFSLSNRLHYVVAQTDVTNLWSVDREKRYIVYLSGILSDLVFISVFIYYIWLSDMNILPYNKFFYSFSKMIILLEFFGIIFQFQFFIRTDMYYVIATKCRCKNLMQDAKNLVKNTLHRIMPKHIKQVDQSNIPQYEMKAIRVYAVLFLLGTIIVLTIFFAFGLPITLVIINDYIYNIINGINTNTRYLYDGIAVIISTGIYFSLLGYSIHKIRKERAAEKAKPTVAWIK